MQTLSVVIITFNEEQKIGQCLDSVKDIADEIIVVDSHSTDATEAICDRYGVKFFTQDWLGYSEQKNIADELATCLYDAAKKYLSGQRIRTDYTDGDPDFEAQFYLLRNTYAAAVLTENCFYDNADDLRFLESEEGQKAIVALHVEGIINFLKSEN